MNEEDSETGGEMSKYRKWKPSLEDYPNLTAIKFTSRERLYNAIDILWGDKNLRRLPRHFCGDNTFIVPTEAVALLRRKGLPFHTGKAGWLGDLPPKIQARLFKQRSL